MRHSALRCSVAGVAAGPAGDYSDLIMISFIVPAHNEESCLPRTLQAIHDAARVMGQPYEIVVDDGCLHLPALTERRCKIFCG